MSGTKCPNSLFIGRLCPASVDSFLITELDYNIRESRRARNVTLKVSRRDGLEVVVPSGFDHQLLPEIVASRRSWIDSQLERFESLPGRFEQDWPPQQLMLGALDKTFSISYQQFDGQQSHSRNRSNDKLFLDHQDDQIEVTLPPCSDDESLVRLFVVWLKGYAKQHFAEVAEELSRDSGLPFEKLVVRGQKTRWGSYSSKGTLSLNYKLLFLPDHLLRHVILHELSHSVHMNHSEEFWALLKSLDEHSVRNDRDLTDAWKYLPGWLD